MQEANYPISAYYGILAASSEECGSGLCQKLDTGVDRLCLDVVQYDNSFVLR